MCSFAAIRIAPGTPLTEDNYILTNDATIVQCSNRQDALPPFKIMSKEAFMVVACKVYIYVLI